MIRLPGFGKPYQNSYIIKTPLQNSNSDRPRLLRVPGKDSLYGPGIAD